MATNTSIKFKLFLKTACTDDVIFRCESIFSIFFFCGIQSCHKNGKVLIIWKKRVCNDSLLFKRENCVSTCSCYVACLFQVFSPNVRSLNSSAPVKKEQNVTLLQRCLYAGQKINVGKSYNNNCFPWTNKNAFSNINYKSVKDVYFTKQ